MGLFMSYDNAGFEAALKDGTDEHFNKTHSFFEQLEELIKHGNHDLFTCHCTSYQIYDAKGSLVFNSDFKKAA